MVAVACRCVAGPEAVGMPKSGPSRPAQGPRFDGRAPQRPPTLAECEGPPIRAVGDLGPVATSKVKARAAFTFYLRVSGSFTLSSRRPRPSKVQFVVHCKWVMLLMTLDVPDEGTR